MHDITFLVSVHDTTLHVFTQSVFPGEGLVARGTRVLLDLEVHGRNVSLVVAPLATPRKLS